MNERDPGESELDRVLTVAYRKANPTRPALFDAVELRRFEDVQPLGVGGMGEVFAARDRVLERRVALKVIRRNLRFSDEARTRFLREARILSHIEHPNVCVLYDYIQSPGADVLVLELIEGETLLRRLERGLERVEALGVAEGIAAALTAAHGAGIVHRDLKPANVMVTPEGVPKVLDFGIAGSDAGGPTVDDAPSLGAERLEAPAPDGVTARGQVLGTPAYMSPEQRRGEAASAASDLYSFGLILQELLGPVPLTRSLQHQDPRSRPTAAEARLALRRAIERPRRRALQGLALVVLFAFALLGTRYVVDVRRERDHALDRQTRAERLIAFLVERVATRIEDVGPRALIEAVDAEAIRYFRGDPETAFSEQELRRRVQALSGYARRVRAYGRLATARALYQEVEGFLEALPAAKRGASEWLFELGQVRFYLGEIARDEGLPSDTQHYWESYADLSEKLALQEPGNLEFLDELAYARTNLGVFQFEQGNARGAEPEFSRALEHWRSRAEEHPGDVALHLEWADALSWYAEARGASGDLAGASEAFAREVEIREGLGAIDPANRTLAHGLVLANYHLGKSLARQGLDGAPESTLRKAYDGIEALVTSDPERAQWKRTRVLVAHGLGLLLDEVGNFGAAQTIHQVALTGIKELLERDPVNGDWVSLAAHVQLAAAQNQSCQGNTASARELLEAAMQRIELDRARIKHLEHLEVEAWILQADLLGNLKDLCARGLDRLSAQDDDSLGDTQRLRLRLYLRLGRHAEASHIADRLVAADQLSGAALRDWVRLGVRETDADEHQRVVR